MQREELDAKYAAQATEIVRGVIEKYQDSPLMQGVDLNDASLQAELQAEAANRLRYFDARIESDLVSGKNAIDVSYELTQEYTEDVEFRQEIQAEVENGADPKSLLLAQVGQDVSDVTAANFMQQERIFNTAIQQADQVAQREPETPKLPPHLRDQLQRKLRSSAVRFSRDLSGESPASLDASLQRATARLSELSAPSAAPEPEPTGEVEYTLVNMDDPNDRLEELVTDDVAPEILERAEAQVQHGVLEAAINHAEQKEAYQQEREQARQQAALEAALPKAEVPMGPDLAEISAQVIAQNYAHNLGRAVAIDNPTAIVQEILADVENRVTKAVQDSMKSKYPAETLQAKTASMRLDIVDQKNELTQELRDVRTEKGKPNQASIDSLELRIAALEAADNYVKQARPSMASEQSAIVIAHKIKQEGLSNQEDAQLVGNIKEQLAAKMRQLTYNYSNAAPRSNSSKALKAAKATTNEVYESNKQNLEQAAQQTQDPVEKAVLSEMIKRNETMHKASQREIKQKQPLQRIKKALSSPKFKRKSSGKRSPRSGWLRRGRRQVERRQSEDKANTSPEPKPRSSSLGGSGN